MHERKIIMSDRTAGFVITLDRDLTSDEAAEVVQALHMIRFVASVEPVTANLDIQIAEGRRDRQWEEAVHAISALGPEAVVALREERFRRR